MNSIGWPLNPGLLGLVNLIGGLIRLIGGLIMLSDGLICLIGSLIGLIGGRLLAVLRVWGETWRLKIRKNIPPPFSSYLGRGLLAGYGGDISDCHGLSTVSTPAIRHDSETGSLNTQKYSHN